MARASAETPPALSSTLLLTHPHRHLLAQHNVEALASTLAAAVMPVSLPLGVRGRGPAGAPQEAGVPLVLAGRRHIQHLLHHVQALGERVVLQQKTTELHHRMHGTMPAVTEPT